MNCTMVFWNNLENIVSNMKKESAIENIAYIIIIQLVPTYLCEKGF